MHTGRSVASRRLARPIGIVSAAVLVAACTSSTPLALRGGVAVSFATRSAASIGPAPSYAPAAPLSDTVVTGTDTLVLSSVQLVLRQISLQTTETGACDASPTPAGCEDVDVGPVLIDLPLTPGATQQFQVEIPTGTYSRIDFEVHRLESGNATDATLLAQHPEFAGKSIRVTGTFDGADFVFESELDVEQENTLNPALVVPEQGVVNVTIFVDVSTWFKTAAGALVDPATANTGLPNESMVTENIKQSLKAFEDDDRNGEGDS